MPDEQRVIHRPGRCVHFTGIMEPRCRAGIDYDTVREAGKSLPCIESGRVQSDCALRQFPTAAQIAASDARTNAYLAKVHQAAEAVHADLAGAREKSGTVDCPVCRQHTLRYSAGPRSIAVACSTEGCVRYSGRRS